MQKLQKQKSQKIHESYEKLDSLTYNIVFGAKGVHYSLIPVAAKPLNNNLKDNLTKRFSTLLLINLAIYYNFN